MIDSEFALILIKWYDQNKRDLPWRKTSNPYKIWLSEIILQQTRVEQGMPYFSKFIKEFPDVFKLADASEQKVLKNWQGLGYYSRARNLHFSAKYIVNELNGEFPKTYKEILILKGVGKYTAAAISSFAFNERQAVVDGNVFRLLSRYFGISEPIDTSKGQKVFSELANQILPLKKVDTYNQSIMEFGALQCTPKKPNCNTCPLNSKCYSLSVNHSETLPIKIKKIKKKNRFFNFMVITDGNSICIEKRKGKGIWQNMYQFPLSEEDHNSFKPDKTLIKNGLLLKKINCTHLLTHQKISAVFWHYEVARMPEDKSIEIINLSSILKYPVPKIVENYIKENLLDVV